MKLKLLFIISLILSCSFAYAQKYTLSGTVVDKDTREPLPYANVQVGTGGAVTDFDGKYAIQLTDGNYEVVVSYVGCEPQTFNITIAGSDVTQDVQLQNSQLLDEVNIIADIAVERETPVAFSNIPTIKLQEELAAQEIPMVLNSTPGAYATQSGGGDGDARITIRGFNQRNIAVMLDGIPVNDMENGWVYWSNWFGLDLVTKTMQVQRGLGASKLSIPSVGGTINILTKGIDSKRGLRFKQEIGNNGFLRSTLGLTSGRLKNGWGVSAAASYKQGDGWVDGTYTQGYFYYLRIDKQIGQHMISLSGFGAPQEHGQRPFTTEIGQVDSQYALDQDVPQEINDQLFFIDRGRQFNEHWGYRDGEVVNLRKNFYHKPQFSLRHSWQASDNLFWSNIAYLSIGNGGGTRPDGPKSMPRTEDGQVNFDEAVATNLNPSPFNPDSIAEHIIGAGMNNHFWYGLLSTFKYNINGNLTLSGGLDGRYYRGDHYRKVIDLLGAAAFRDGGNRQIDSQTNLKEDDRYGYDYSGFVRWGGLFGLLEYKRNNWSAFVNLSTATSGYKAEDYMKPKEVALSDTTFYVSYGDTISHNDNTYHLNSSEAKNQVTDWINVPSYTFKMGASYKIADHSSIFVNTGYLSKSQRFGNVINANRFGDRILEFDNYENEEILAFELGYSFKSEIFSGNLNSYYTKWNNKPLDRPPTVLEDPSDPESDRIPVNVIGIEALHMGLELDFAFKPHRMVTFEGLASIGDWQWTSGAEVISPEGELIYDFDAKGVHVGDAAQVQLGGLIRVEPMKGLYFKIRGTYFDKYYSDFQPEDLKGETARRDSWKLPSYNLFNFHTGYNFNVKKTRMGVRFNILNLFDTVYVSDARNNDDFNSPSSQDFDAKSASVHFGQGRRWTSSFSISF